MYGAHNRKGESFTDEDVLGGKPQNQYMLCGENEEKMILFLTSGNQVKKCWKGQPSSFGPSVGFFCFFFAFKNCVTPLQVNENL